MKIFPTLYYLPTGLDIGDRMVANGDCEFGFGDCEKKSVASEIFLYQDQDAPTVSSDLDEVLFDPDKD